MRNVLYMLVQVVWGFPQTLAGFIVFLAHRRLPHFRYHGAIVTVWDLLGQGLSLGPFLFVCRPGSASPPDVPDQTLVVHEYGHSVQSLIFGPLYLLVIGLPSVIWAKVPAIVRHRQRDRVSYYAFYPERFANWLGERVLHEPSPGQALVD